MALLYKQIVHKFENKDILTQVFPVLYFAFGKLYTYLVDGSRNIIFRVLWECLCILKVILTTQS